MGISTTVICHFFNEEVYLPVWLRHHVRLFDHGILIDYRSTDCSREIIRDLAPHWKIVTTANAMFETYAIDREVMEYERSVEGWKTALNVTEFLITDNLHGEIETFAKEHPSQQGFTTTGCLIMESPGEKDKSTSLEDRIWEQFHFGRVQTSPQHVDPIPIQRNRLIHKAGDGRYGPGRHANGIAHIIRPLYLFWYAWCPLRLKKLRNAQTRSRIPQENLRLGWGSHHVLDPENVEQVWRSYVPHCYDLLDGRQPELNAAVERLRCPEP